MGLTSLAGKIPPAGVGYRAPRRLSRRGTPASACSARSSQDNFGLPAVYESGADHVIE
jgi:hypothetical protein